MTIWIHDSFNGECYWKWWRNKIKGWSYRIEKDDTFNIKLTDNEEIKAKYLINAAGVYSDKIHNMICKESLRLLQLEGNIMY